jgi:hypothetical protein
MGCDIHCYVEYRDPKSDRGWNGFGGRINPGRNYWMFGAMAGVRTDNIPYIEPRGLPEDVAYDAFGDATIYVVEDQVEPTSGSGEDYSYSRARAEEHVQKGYCQYVSRNGNHNRWVTNSDWHSYSWLSADEFELAIAAYLKASGFQINTPRLSAPSEINAITTTASEDAWDNLKCIREYWAILSAMRCFEAQGYESRLVFWFDN